MAEETKKGKQGNKKPASKKTAKKTKTSIKKEQAKTDQRRKNSSGNDFSRSFRQSMASLNYSRTVTKSPNT